MRAPWMSRCGTVLGGRLSYLLATHSLFSDSIPQLPDEQTEEPHDHSHHNAYDFQGQEYTQEDVQI